MDIQYVEPGKQAPDSADKVTINKLPSGKSGFTGVVLTGSVYAHFVHANDFNTPEEAEQAALALAESRGAKLLYVERPDA